MTHLHQIVYQITQYVIIPSLREFKIYINTKKSTVSFGKIKIYITEKITVPSRCDFGVYGKECYTWKNLVVV